MAYNKTSAVMNKINKPVATFGSEPLVIPNHSGQHEAGRVDNVQERDNAIVNKKYLNDNTFWSRTGTTLKPKTSGDSILSENRVSAYSNGQGFDLYASRDVTLDPAINIYYNSDIISEYYYDISEDEIILNSKAGKFTIDSDGTLDITSSDTITIQSFGHPLANPNVDIILNPAGDGVVNVSSSKITNVTDPTSNQDAATKNYVDTKISTDALLLDQTTPQTVTSGAPIFEAGIKVGDFLTISDNGTNTNFDLTSGDFNINSNVNITGTTADVLDINTSNSYSVVSIDSTNAGGTIQSIIRFKEEGNNKFTLGFKEDSNAFILDKTTVLGSDPVFSVNRATKDFKLPNDNQKLYFGAGDDCSMYFNGTNQQFSLTSGEFFFNAGGTTAHTPALGTPALVITDDYNGVSGLSFSNISTGTGADTRFMIKDTGGHYFTFGQPSLTNTATLFGLNRSEIDTIFNAGGTSRDIVIGTLGSKSVYLASNGALRFEVDSSGNIHNNADNKKIYLGAGNDSSIYYDGTNLHIDAQEIGSGTIILDNLPTSDPTIAGAVWNNSGVLNISSG